MVLDGEEGLEDMRGGEREGIQCFGIDTFDADSCNKCLKNNN